MKTLWRIGKKRTFLGYQIGRYVSKEKGPYPYSFSLSLFKVEIEWTWVHPFEKDAKYYQLRINVYRNKSVNEPLLLIRYNSKPSKYEDGSDTKHWYFTSYIPRWYRYWFLFFKRIVCFRDLKRRIKEIEDFEDQAYAVWTDPMNGCPEDFAESFVRKIRGFEYSLHNDYYSIFPDKKTKKHKHYKKTLRYKWDRFTHFFKTIRRKKLFV